MLIKTGILTEQLLPGIRDVSTCPSPAEVKSANTFKNEKVRNGISKLCVCVWGRRETKIHAKLKIRKMSVYVVCYAV